jgi:aminoglycoside/choline kinase family phosphotransferase
MDKIKTWLATTPYKEFEINSASSDASFRKYYRLSKDNKTFLLMDSSLEIDSLQPFIRVTQKLLDVKVKAPQILETNLEDGFLILEDFGSQHYLDILDWDNFEDLYKRAIDEIVKMQEASVNELPVYDKAFLLKEMNLMQEWYLEKLLPVTLSAPQKEVVHEVIHSIADIVLEQPQNVFVHRDSYLIF